MTVEACAYVGLAGAALIAVIAMMERYARGDA
jgi:hypothetical protein